MSKCQKFVPFEADLEVCDTCGDLARRHPAVVQERSEYRQDLWMTLLRHGGIHNFYGGLDEFKTAELRMHFGIDVDLTPFQGHYRVPEVPKTVCKIDFQHSKDPKWDTVEEFAGTFTDAQQVGAVVGGLWCKCHKYVYESVSLEGKTLGQLIWLVTHERD